MRSTVEKEKKISVVVWGMDGEGAGD